MSTNFVKFLTTDNLVFPALLYEPKVKTTKAAIWLHGCGGGSILSVDRMNAVGNELTKSGISFLPFNNRGALIIDRIKRLNDEGEIERIPAGTAYELIKDCIIDIDSAITYLKALGYEEFYLIGHSTGANKICVYNYYKPENVVSKYILLGGGDDTGLFYDEMGEKLFKEALDKCRSEIKKGHNLELVRKSITSYIYSYQSFYDTINPDGDYNTFPYIEYKRNLKLSTKKLFREFNSIKKPTLIMYGELDEYIPGANETVEILKTVSENSSYFEYKIIAEADHGFYGKELELAQTIATWLGGNNS